MSGKYVLGFDRFANGDIDFINGDIRAILIDTAEYTADLGTDEFLQDIPVAARIATIALTGKSVSGGGICDADDAVFPQVSAGQIVGAVVLYNHTDYENSSALMAYLDDSPDLPVTTDGDDVTITWDNGSNKIFAL